MSIREVFLPIGLLPKGGQPLRPWTAVCPWHGAGVSPATIAGLPASRWLHMVSREEVVEVPLQCPDRPEESASQ
eukprot:9387344-Alexandrium_andersonii.AAC.1